MCRYLFNYLSNVISISRSFGNHLKNINSNDTFSSMFSDELTENDLVKRTFSEMSSNKKNNAQMDSMYSSLSGQSSLGILELDNMSGN